MDGIEQGIGQAIERIDIAMGARFDRRKMIKYMTATGVAAVAGAVLTALPASAAEPVYFLRATADLNLREKPKTSSKVIIMIPEGAKVAIGVGAADGKLKNGFRHVNFKGASGWASSDYLILAASPEGAAWVGTAKTNVKAKLRNGPLTSYDVLKTVPKGATVQVSDWVSGNARYCSYQGVKGWIAEKYLDYDV